MEGRGGFGEMAWGEHDKPEEDEESTSVTEETLEAAGINDLLEESSSVAEEVLETAGTNDLLEESSSVTEEVLETAGTNDSEPTVAVSLKVWPKAELWDEINSGRAIWIVGNDRRGNSGEYEWPCSFW